METLIKEKFLFSAEKIKGFLETNPVQGTLREQVADLMLKIKDLEFTIEQQSQKVTDQNQGENNEQNLQAKVEALKEKLEIKEGSISQL